MHPTFTIALVGKDLWTGIPIVEKVIRTLGVYLGLVILLRVGGKRDLAQLNSFDLVVLLLLSNVVQNAVIGNDTSLSGGLLGAAVLVAANAAAVRLFGANERTRRLFEGSPTTLVHDGTLLERALHRLGLRRGDVVSALRRQGADRLDEVEDATLAPGGAIVVRLRPEAQDATKADLAGLEQRLGARIDELIAAVGRAGEG
jgi:uncharacterized membrane protein YcaP (DUF421 family)